MAEKTPNPYVGPRAIRRKKDLHGRDRELRELTDLLLGERVVLMHSPSGAGKTSLIQAGLIPELRDHEKMLAFRPVRVNTPAPAGNPMNRYVWSTLLHLAAGTERYDPDTQDGTLSLGPDTLQGLWGQTITGYLKSRTGGDGADHVIVFDQFEEVLTVDPADWTGQEEFFLDLGDAMKQQNRWLLISMREDYMGGLERYLRHLPGRLRARYRLDFLGHDAALEAVKRPAEDARVPFTDDAAKLLVDNLSKVVLHTTGSDRQDVAAPYVEPVYLQVVCRRLWKNLRPLRRGLTSIDARDVEEAGDLGEALSDFYAEAVGDVAKETGAPELAIRDWCEKQLITPRGFRQQTLENPDVESPQQVLQGLQDHYLIRRDVRGPTTWYELAHDMLVMPIRGENDRWRRKELHEYENAARDWDANGRRETDLLRNNHVPGARYWLDQRGDAATDLERDFVTASEEAQRAATLRERYGQAVLILAFFVLVETVVIIALLLVIII
jgi:hypothetical protein